jgi:DNA recombination protein RmuC
MSKFKKINSIYKERIKSLEEENEKLLTELENEREERVIFKTKLEESEKNLMEQKKLLDEANEKLTESFKAISNDLLSSNQKVFIEMAETVFKKTVEETKGTLKVSEVNIEKIINPLKENIERYNIFLREAERKRAEEFGNLSTQVKNLMILNQNLQKETSTLSSALKTPKTRGKWGELTLRNLVTMAGMSEYCDFEEQVHYQSEDKTFIPDMIVRFPDERKIAIDSKVPFDAYFRAIESNDEELSEKYFKEHAKTIKEHIKKLGKKEYQERGEDSFDFVVLFLPAESFFSEALKRDNDIIEEGIKRKVIIATPTTLLALLRTVAYSWRQYKMVENVKKISETGRELYTRLKVFSNHFAAIAKNISQLNTSFNKSVGSWKSRVIPQVKKLNDLGISDSSESLSEINPVDSVPEQLKE